MHFGRQPEAAETVNRMVASIRHRGPDDEGSWSDRDVALGFARLSIIDLAGGAQPMPNEDGTVWVVFNGEIYNHRQLRSELEAAGHRFRSDHSDTEVLVHGFEEWGTGLLGRLNGMYAFAIWDTRARRLLLARDRHGVKPLYLAPLPDGRLLFASELRALLASGLVDARADARGVLEYLSLQNLWDGRTPFAGIELLPAGHFQMVTPEGGRRVEFWGLRMPRDAGSTLEEAAEQHRALLLEVMERQIAADVPVMAYLSGGIDSTAVTVAAHRLDHRVRAYSCIFNLTGVGDDRIVDEREFSRAVAERYGLDRVEMEVEPEALQGCLDDTIRALEYPRMGMAYVNYLIAGRVSRDAKVVLSGMGGDEFHGGYVGRYALVPRVDSAAEPRASPPGSLRGLLAGWLRRRSVEPPVGSRVDPLEIYRKMLSFPIPEARRVEALTSDFLAEAGEFPVREVIDEQIARAPSRDPWDVVMYVDARTYLHGLLVLEDKLSMAHSLETRVPLLDDALVDYVNTLPWPLLCDGSEGKRVFRHSVRPWVPDTVFTKPKMGFGPPDASWYRGALRPWIETALSPSRIQARGVFRPPFVARILAEHFTGQANHLPLIWSMLSLESWCRQFGVLGGELGVPA